MKETKFIEQNKKKWNRFEKLSESQTKDPEELSSLYMDITDDLSYAQTFYNRRTVKVYLNQLAQRVYTGLHIQKGESFRKIIQVWKISLPLEIYRARKNLLFALVVFLVWASLGAVSTHYNPDFPRIVLSDGYVDLTNENIAKGKPLDIYQDESNLGMFIDITTNNLRVAFLCFILGIFFTIGTHIFLFQNAVMVGTFQYFFATKGLLITSFLGIWIHGAFEISAIVLAAGAGVTMGNGWLFPKNYTRMQSLQLSAKRGLKIMLSLVPFIIMAGFLESYVTANYQSLPEWSKWTLILFSFGIILFYYVIYPAIVARKYPHLVNAEETVNTFPNKGFDLLKLRSLGEIVADSFRFYRLNFGKMARINLCLTFPLALVLVYFQNIQYSELMATNHWFDWSKQLEIMMGFGYNSTQDYLVNFGWTILTAIVFVSVSYTFSSLGQPCRSKDFIRFARTKFVGVWLGILVLFYALSLITWWWYFILLFALPLFYLNGAVAGIVNDSFGRRFSLSWKYSVRSYGNGLLTIMLFTVIMTLFAQPIAFVGSIHDGTLLQDPPLPDLLDLACDFIRNICYKLDWDAWYISNVFRQLVYLSFLFFVLPLWIVAIHFIAYNEHEKETASGLRRAFALFGKRSRVKENEADYEA
ncbi:MAG: stage II sporulation protein M [Bacteroidota bacterium]